MNQTCPFCQIDPDREIIVESESAFAIYDKFPVNQGHALIIPKWHVANFFELSIETQTECIILLNKVKEQIDLLHNPDGYNVGINIHETAGQTVPHVHIHLIPRYTGDVDEPRGGVRGVIPDKRDY